MAGIDITCIGVELNSGERDPHFLHHHLYLVFVSLLTLGGLASITIAQGRNKLWEEVKATANINKDFVISDDEWSTAYGLTDSHYDANTSNPIRDFYNNEGRMRKYLKSVKYLKNHSTD